MVSTEADYRQYCVPAKLEPISKIVMWLPKQRILLTEPQLQEPDEENRMPVTLRRCRCRARSGSSSPCCLEKFGKNDEDFSIMCVGNLSMQIFAYGGGDTRNCFLCLAPSCPASFTSAKACRLHADTCSLYWDYKPDHDTRENGISHFDGESNGICFDNRVLRTGPLTWHTLQNTKRFDASACDLQLDGFPVDVGVNVISEGWGELNSGGANV